MKYLFYYFFAYSWFFKNKNFLILLFTMFYKKIVEWLFFCFSMELVKNIFYKWSILVFVLYLQFTCFFNFILFYNFFIFHIRYIFYIISCIFTNFSLLISKKSILSLFLGVFYYFLYSFPINLLKASKKAILNGLFS